MVGVRKKTPCDSDGQLRVRVYLTYRKIRSGRVLFGQIESRFEITIPTALNASLGNDCLVSARGHRQRIPSSFEAWVLCGYHLCAAMIIASIIDYCPQRDPRGHHVGLAKCENITVQVMCMISKNKFNSGFQGLST